MIIAQANDHMVLYYLMFKLLFINTVNTITGTQL